MRLKEKRYLLPFPNNSQATPLAQTAVICSIFKL